MPEQVMFVPECHVDTALVHALVADRRTLITTQHS